MSDKDGSDMVRGQIGASPRVNMVTAVSQVRGGRWRRILFLVLAFSLSLVPVAPVLAQQPRANALEFIRDAEIEHIIRGYAEPIFAVAGVDANAVEIILVKDQVINAFVAGGMNMFIYTGLLMECDNPDQLVGVIAHETGHIAGGHLIRSRDAMEQASAEALLAMLLGVGAAIASSQPGAAAVVVTGGESMAERSLLAFSRAQEASADAAGLSYLDAIHLSARGMRDFLNKLAGQELLPVDRQAAYTRTHPLTRERIDAVENHVENSSWKNTTMSASAVEQFARLKAKLMGFVNPPLALRRYSATDTSIPARYARAIAYYQQGNLNAALPMIDALIAQEPRNPFFYELKGQVLMENQRVVDSLTPYRRSVELLPTSSLLRGALAQALLETNNPALTDEALKNLQVATQQEKSSPYLWRMMATVWDRKHDNGMVAYTLAEEALARGDRAMARYQSEQAEKLLPVGSLGWLRAQDIRGLAESH